MTIKTCSVSGCDKKLCARGLCRNHWHKWRKNNGPKCSVDGCDRVSMARGYCYPHYKRVLRYGNPRPELGVGETNGAAFKYGTPRLRFFVNLDWDQIESNEDCWMWSGACKGAYPMLSDHALNKNRSSGAHRWAYMRWVGEIPKGWHVDHLCGNQHCVNPEHLEAVPNQVNILRGMADSIREKYGEAALSAEAEQLLDEVRGDRNRRGYWYGVAKQL